MTGKPVASIVVIAIAAVGFGALGGFVARNGVHELGFAFGHPPLTVHCAGAARQDCVAISRGVVQPAPAGADLRVSVGDRDLGIDLAGTRRPADRARVDLETWHGRVVSVFEPRTERRYRTDGWPSGWSDIGSGVVELLVGLGLAAGGALAVLGEIRERRRAAAAQ